MTKSEIIKETNITLKKLLSEYEDKGILSIYLWGSAITPDFNTKTSDVDAVAILSDKADLDEMLKIREWLPNANPRLVRLQINFFYLSDLTGEKPIMRNTNRPSTPDQAVFDLSHWKHVCGQRIKSNELKVVTPKEFLNDQIEIVNTREMWARNPKTKMDLQYYCKSLIWLCFAIHKQDHPHNGFSWQSLQDEANEDTLPLVVELFFLKNNGWENEQIRTSLPFFYKKASSLIKLYS